LFKFINIVFSNLIVVTGGPSGSGKTSLAHKMANIVGCEVVSLESYFKSEQVKDFKYDDFSSLDLSLLSKVGRCQFYSSYADLFYINNAIIC
jgi:deoxyadenosine/deoxycytidine kinase